MGERPVRRYGGALMGDETGMVEKLKAQRDRFIAFAFAGADLLLVECIPVALAREVSLRARVPVVGIGSGPACDGQILVCYDALGMSPHRPSFVHDFLADTGSVQAAFAAYTQAVHGRRFPTD